MNDQMPRLRCVPSGARGFGADMEREIRRATTNGWASIAARRHPTRRPQAPEAGRLRDMAEHGAAPRAMKVRGPPERPGRMWRRMAMAVPRRAPRRRAVA